MIRLPVLRVVACVLVTFWIASSVNAVDHPNQQKGFIPGDLFQFNDLDHINLFNGNLNLHLPLGQTFNVDGALSYRFGIAYSGNNWDYGVKTVSCVGEEDCPTSGPSAGQRTYKQSFLISSESWNAGRKWNAGLGWLLSLGRLTIDTVYAQQGGALIKEVPQSYTGPDAADHEFYSTLHEGETVYGTTAFPTVRYTRDGSYLRVKKITYQNGSVTVTGWDLEMPGGAIHRFDAAGFLIEMRDRFANKVTVTYTTQDDLSPKWTITEAGRRSHVVEFKRISVSGAGSLDPAYFDVVKTVRLSSAAGTANYVFHYGESAPCDPESSNACEVVKISRQHVGNFDPALGKTVRAPLLRSITLPDGSSYTMTKAGNVPDYDLGD